MNPMHVEFNIPPPLGAQAGLTPENASEQTRRMLTKFFYEHSRAVIHCEFNQAETIAAAK